MNLSYAKELMVITALIAFLNGCEQRDDNSEASGLSSDIAIVETDLVSYEYKANTTVSEDSIHISWNENEDVEYYRLIIGVEGDEEVVSIELDQDELEYVDFSVESGVEYSYELNAYDREGTLLGTSIVHAHINESIMLHSDEAI